MLNLAESAKLIDSKEISHADGDPTFGAPSRQPEEPRVKDCYKITPYDRGTDKSKSFMLPKQSRSK